MFYHQKCYDREYCYDAEQEIYLTLDLIEIAAEYLKIHHKQSYHDGYEKNLSEQGKTFLGHCFAAAVPFFLHGTEYVELLLVNDFSAVDNLLSVHHVSCGP